MTAPLATTDRLAVRPLADRDAPWLADLHSRPEVTRPLGLAERSTEEDERARLATWRARYPEATGYGVWGLWRLDGPPVGVVMLVPLRPQGEHDGIEVGWRLNPDHWGHGYATEGASALLDLGFAERGLDTVQAVILPENARSRAVAERLGMERRGQLPYADLLHDLWTVDAGTWAARR
jgi:RimJ/RimL family protein N-acetyltransferase